ncbi:Protein Mpv17, putative [Perkinsus marinus ATCC 50983]|uniref:Protein Mpv17, putative n=1 Tax=Perkinsus marinus (strain ATCC 50983 / TXsc) TaxID=423536 RepID=C5LMR7_PERM5|nr:Protein Mpv17, putative [Perkinsus marinus ATCC 50983]EER01958.1 Protein Mpv17, putative [Perkinsus marinus ATCC 50983]|eukprot:XP_002769240.1 Protein Mpv17, putative [Perkinsus marinus ATCC 50983]
MIVSSRIRAFSMPRVREAYARSPVLANSAMSFVCYALSDIIAQRADANNDKKIDGVRLLSVSLCGPILGGVCLTKLYKNLDRFIGSGHSLKVAARKIFFMQIVYMPFSVSTFIFLSSSLNAFLKGERLTVACGEASAVTKLRWREAYWTSWFIWPVSDAFNFTLVQRHMPAARPTWDAVVMVAWNAYLSWRAIGGHSITEVLFPVRMANV